MDNFQIEQCLEELDAILDRYNPTPIELLGLLEHVKLTWWNFGTQDVDDE